jgi:hypothetical protein
MWNGKRARHRLAHIVMVLFLTPSFDISLCAGGVGSAIRATGTAWAIGPS